MAVFHIPYDQSVVKVKIPEQNVLYSYVKTAESDDNDNSVKLAAAINKAPLNHIVDKRSVCLVVEDATREVPLTDLLKAIAEPIRFASSVTVFLATGTHDGESDANYKIVDEIKRVARDTKWMLHKIIIHNCHHDKMNYCGKTKTLGNDIFVNAETDHADVFVTLSDMKNHYFAGYSNAVKNFIPGLCAYQTVERNHALALDERSTFGYHPIHPDASRRENPLALDMWEGYQLIVRDRPVYVLATISQKNKILWCTGGLLKKVVSAGIRKVDQLMGIHLKPADFLIVSCGGYPNDESLYSAQRALELSKRAVKIGGGILFFAGCRKGIGPEQSIINFYNPLKSGIDQILNSSGKKYKMYAHKTYKFAQLIKQMNQIFVKSELKDDQISVIHLQPITNVQKQIDEWLMAQKKATFNILTEGNKVAVYA